MAKGEKRQTKTEKGTTRLSKAQQSEAGHKRVKQANARLTQQSDAIASEAKHRKARQSKAKQGDAKRANRGRQSKKSNRREGVCGGGGRTHCSCALLIASRIPFETDDRSTAVVLLATPPTFRRSFCCF